MRVYTFHLRKGGDGKTTLTGNVATGLARRGIKTCVIDCDTQANLSTWLAGDRGEFELADYFEGRCTAAQAVLDIEPNLDCIVTAKKNSDLVEWETAKFAQSVFVFRKLVRDLKELSYEAVFFDLPPTFTTLHSRAYLAVDEVIACSSPTQFSEDGLVKLAEDLAIVNEDFEVSVQYRKLVLDKVDLRVREDKERLEDIKGLEDGGYTVFVVPTSTAFTRSQAASKTVYDVDRSKQAVESVEKIVDVIRGEVRG